MTSKVVHETHASIGVTYANEAYNPASVHTNEFALKVNSV